MSKFKPFLIFFTTTLLFLNSCSSYQVWIPNEIKQNKNAVKLYLKTYRSYAHHKAIAINTYGNIYATAGYPTQQLAKLNALKGCQENFVRRIKKYRKNLTRKLSEKQIKNITKCRVIDLDGVYIKLPFLSKDTHAGKKIYLDEQGIPHIIGFHQVDLYSIKYDYLNSKQERKDYNIFSHYYNPISPEFTVTKSNIIYYGLAELIETKSLNSKTKKKDAIYIQTFNKSLKEVSSVYFTPTNHNNISASSIEFIPPSSLMVTSEETVNEEDSLSLSVFDLAGNQIFHKSLSLPYNDVVGETLDQEENIYLVYQTGEDKLKYYLLALNADGKEKYRNEIKLGNKGEDIAVLELKSYKNQLYLFYTEDNSLYLNHYNNQGKLAKRTKLNSEESSPPITVFDSDQNTISIFIPSSGGKISLYQYDIKNKKITKKQQLDTEANSFSDAVVNSDDTVFLLGWFDIDWKPTSDDEDHPTQKTILILDKSGKTLNPLKFKN